MGAFIAVLPITAIAQPHYENEEFIQLSGYEGIRHSENKGFDPCSCVSLSKSLAGFNGQVGWARKWPINRHEPAVGEVVVLDESFYGHTAYITEVYKDSFKVTETNYIPCKRSERIIKNNYSKIIGFYETS